MSTNIAAGGKKSNPRLCTVNLLCGAKNSAGGHLPVLQFISAGDVFTKKDI